MFSLPGSFISALSKGLERSHCGQQSDESEAAQKTLASRIRRLIRIDDPLHRSYKEHGVRFMSAERTNGSLESVHPHFLSIAQAKRPNFALAVSREHG